MASPLTDADIQSIDAGKPLPALTDADISAHDSASSDPLGTLTPEEYGKLSSGQQSIRQGLASLKQSHPIFSKFLEGAYESLPGGMEMTLPGSGPMRALTALGGATKAAKALPAPGTPEAVAIATGHPQVAAGLYARKAIPAIWNAFKETGEPMSEVAPTGVTPTNINAPAGIKPEDWAVIPKPMQEAITRAAEAAEARKVPPPAPAPEPAPVNTVPEAQAIDTSALPVKKPTEDQAAKVIPFSNPEADPEVFAAKNRAPRVQKFADYLQSNKVPISDLTQLSTDDPFWGQLGKAVGIKSPSKQTVMDTISELLKRQAIQSGGPLANNPAAMKAAMALRDAMNQ